MPRYTCKAKNLPECEIMARDSKKAAIYYAEFIHDAYPEVLWPHESLEIFVFDKSDWGDKIRVGVKVKKEFFIIKENTDDANAP